MYFRVDCFNISGLSESRMLSAVVVSLRCWFTAAQLWSPALGDMWRIPRFYLLVACPGSISHAASGVCQITEQEQVRWRSWEEVRESESSNHTPQLPCRLRPSSVTPFTRVALRLIEAPGIRLEDEVTRLAAFSQSCRRTKSSSPSRRFIIPTGTADLIKLQL